MYQPVLRFAYRQALIWHCVGVLVMSSLLDYLVGERNQAITSLAGILLIYHWDGESWRRKQGSPEGGRLAARQHSSEQRPDVG
ncbi:hypothetical protein GGS24DRAFT_67359 [Hypoxylon argillaceum]|nr:hypothetical protein GGS24DRAFT_67359 [Hypoxylon argillaceum]